MTEDIQEYIRYFRDQVPVIQAVASTLHRKVLCVTLMDAMSRGGFPDVRRHRERVTTFIDTCSGWPDKDRVSALQLKLTLEGEGQAVGGLYEAVLDRVTGWMEGTIIRPDADSEISDLASLATQNQSRLLEHARYVQLLYTYRNHLVHEYREPGQGMEISNDPSTPYYHSVHGEGWELVFPVGFFLEICRSCIDGLERYLLDEEINPYESYAFGTLWSRR